MKVKAIVQFKDYKENVIRQIGDVFEVTQDRYNEIVTKGGNWVELVDNDEYIDVDIDDIDLSKIKRKELEDIARLKGISDDEIQNAQNKDVLIKLIEGK